MQITILDVLIIAFLVFFIIMYLTGNSDKVTAIFGGKQQGHTESPELKKKLDTASLSICVVILAMEICSIAFNALTLVWLAVSIVAFIVYVTYLHKMSKS